MSNEAEMLSGGQPHVDVIDTPAGVARPPHWLRLARGVAGVVLLVAAWAAIMTGLWLVTNMFTPLWPHPTVAHAAMSALGVVGTCWLGVTALAALLAGAFCLMLALTSRGW